MRPTIEVLPGLSSPELVGEIMVTTFFLAAPCGLWDLSSWTRD